MYGSSSTADLVTECKARLPIRVSSTFWIKRLNEAYRWVCQQGAYPWTLQRTAATVDANGLFYLPVVWFAGRPIYIWKDGLLIPQKSWEEATKHQIYSSEIDMPGNYSCWAYRVELTYPPGTYQYIGQMFPTASYPAATDTVEIAYHASDFTDIIESSSAYFPTPPEFDELIVALAEAEARRRYGTSGWEKIQTRAQTGIQNLLKTYVSDKHTQFGLENTQRHAAENQLAKSV